MSEQRPGRPPDPPAGALPRRARMRDVAELAGVSLKTVSRVVNGEPGVSALLAARVGAAMEHLGYRPNTAAADLRRGTPTRTLGLIIEDVANPFWAALIAGVEQAAAERGLLVFVCSSGGDPERERQLLAGLVGRQVQGVVLVPVPGPGEAASAPADVPLVYCDRRPDGSRHDTVTSDNAGGTSAAVRRLIRAGHRRIGYLGDRPALFTAAARHAAWQETLARAGLVARPELAVTGLLGADQALAAARRLLSLAEPPSALLTGNNLITEGALRAVRERGLPVALAGFDEFAYADLVDADVTVVAQDPRLMGRTAADLLFDRLAGFAGEPRHVELPVRLLPASRRHRPRGPRIRQSRGT